MNEPIKIFSTDVLVIGGGIAGLVAANKAADQGASVLIAEKSTAGWGGQMPISGGFFMTLPEDHIEAMIKLSAEAGEYLNDQDFLTAFMKSTYPCVQEMADWGVPFEKRMDGKLKLIMGEFSNIPRVETGLPALLSRAMRLGVKVINKLYMVDLLKHDGRISGAVGFHYQTGEFMVIKAKTIILACGGCMYKTRPLWHMNCGEGVAMAYNAGAEMRNAEFANMFHIANKITLDDAGASIDPCEHLIANALGEKLSEKYNLKSDQPPCKAIMAAIKEIESGRGPLYLDVTQHSDLFGLGGHPAIGEQEHGYAKMMQRKGIDISREKVEWEIVPEFHAGPIRVDLTCETTVPGLYAVGDSVFHGSGWIGALDWYRGRPLVLAAVTGLWAGTAAGKKAADVPDPEFNISEIEELRKEIFAPLGKENGLDPYKAIKDIQEVIFKIKNSYSKNGDRLENALGKIEKIKSELPDLAARDSHELVRCYEAKSMITSGELLYRASLMRTESRGSNIREDFPERDDKNWLKWLIIRKDGNRMKLWTEPVPINRYQYKPSQV